MDEHKIEQVQAIDNHIYFYGDVESENCLELSKELRRLNMEYQDCPPIYLHIQSYGGDPFCAFAIVDLLREMKCPVHSIVEGLAASAAVMIAASCNRRSITKNSFMMVHQLSRECGDKFHEINDNLKLLEMATQTMIDILDENSKLPSEEIRRLLDRDSWFNASQALELGFVDEII